MGSNEQDDIFQALAHRIRRGIIRALGEKGELSFTDLLKELGIEDSSLLAFHMKKLEGFIRRNRRGYYELTSTGWKAFRVLKELERESVSDELAKAIEARASWGTHEVREEGEVVRVSGLITYTLTNEFVKELVSSGKGLVIEDVIALDVDDGISRDDLSKVLKEVRNVVAIRAPPHLVDLISSRSREVLAITGRGVKGRYVSSTYLPKFVSGLVSDVVKNALKSIKLGLKGVLITISPPGSGEEIHHDFPTKPRLIINSSGSELRLLSCSGDSVRLNGKSTGFSGGLSNYVVSGDSVLLNLSACSADLCIPTEGVRELSMELSGSEVNIEGLKSPTVTTIKSRGSDVRGELVFSELSTFKLDSTGSEVNLKLRSVGVSRNSLVSIKCSGDEVRLTIEIPRECRVRVITSKLLSSDVSLNVNDEPVPLNYEEPGEGPELSIELDCEYSDLTVSVIKGK